MKLKNKKIHIIGIGGISLSAIAKMLLNFGCYLSGSDILKSNLTLELEACGIKINYVHASENVHGADMVISSAAIHNDNPEIIEAKKLGIKIYTRAELLGEISRKYKNVITIAGSHGKTTTTGMIAECFINAGRNPTIHIGGILKSVNANVVLGDSKYFISEACEYKDSFLQFSPNCAVALNIQPDHMDYFKTFSNLQKSFEKYLKNTKLLGFNVLNADDENLLKINHKKRVITYGIENIDGDIRAVNIRKNKCSMYSFDVLKNGKTLTRIKLNIPGKHEIYNALACISVCMNYKIPIHIVKKSLEHYSGIKRRFENIGSINGAKVIHDYAHHPTEIQATIDAVKGSTNGRVIVVFQPHTYSRTKELWNEFIKSLSIANVCYMYKIYAARENPIDGITSEALSKDIENKGTLSKAFHNYTELIEELKTTANSGDIILILGAGDIDRLQDYIK